MKWNNQNTIKPKRCSKSPKGIKISERVLIYSKEKGTHIGRFNFSNNIWEREQCMGGEDTYSEIGITHWAKIKEPD